jgi:hypothetical protein
MAVQLAKRHGISHTAAALGVDFYRLKKQVEASGDDPPRQGTAFVEFTAPVVGKQCLLEVDSSAGARLRVQLVGYDAGDIEILARTLWQAD